MSYLECHIPVSADQSDYLMAQLIDIGFESFMETEEALLGYVDVDQWDKDRFEVVIAAFDISSENVLVKPLEDKNWNEEWEKNFDPVYVHERCVVKAPFHSLPQTYEYEILVNPKMAFGTGHHETTRQILRFQLDIDHANKRVLDVGCGTGILSIMATLRGADYVLACDIDDWSFQNTQENVGLNHVDNVHVFLGGIELVEKSDQFEIVLANINKNIILSQLEAYTHHTLPQGLVLLSGFYDHDVDDIHAMAQSLGLEMLHRSIENDWAALVYKKI